MIKENLDSHTLQIIIKHYQTSIRELRDSTLLMIEGIAIVLFLLLFINVLMIHQIKKINDEGIKHYVLIDDLNIPADLRAQVRTELRADLQRPTEDVSVGDPVHHESESKED